MKCPRLRLICGVSFFMMISMAGGVSHAQDKGEAKAPVRFTTDVKASSTFLDDMDLGTGTEGGSQSQSLEIKPKLEGKFNNIFSFLFEARGVKNYGEGSSIDPETGEAEGRDDFVELRQAWFEFGDFERGDSVTARLGRQRIREDYSFWWNRDQDAARILFNKEKVKGFLGVGQNMLEYRSSGDYFNEDDEDLLRVFGETSLSWLPGHAIEMRGLFQDDRSDLETTNALVKNDDFDENDADLAWLGLRLKGHMGEGDPNNEPQQVSSSAYKTGYRLDLAAVIGQEDSITTTSGPGSSLRTVTGHSERDVFGWAVDAGLDFPVSLVSLKPVLHVGYAFGSGDDNASDGDDNAFRQTGLDGNSSRIADFTAPVNNYGSVLRPDLSNIHIATVGFTLPVSGATSLAGFYRYYRLAEEEGEITSSIDATLNGEDSNLGQGFDLVLSSNLDEQFGVEQKILKRVNFRTTLGAFRSGDAYGDADGETALRGQFDLSLRF